MEIFESENKQWWQLIDELEEWYENEFSIRR